MVLRTRSTARTSETGSNQSYTPPPHTTTGSLGTDGGEVPAQHRARRPRRVGGEAEGHDVDETAQGRVVVVRRRIDAAGVGERAEPEVALSLTGTQEEVTPAEVLVDDRHLMGDGLFVVLVVAPTSFEVLEMRGDVHVDDERNGAGRDLGMTTHHAGRCEHHVGLLHQRGQATSVVGHRAHPHGVVVARRSHRAGEGDVVARRQHLGQVPGTDGGSRHGVGQRVEGEDEKARSHQSRDTPCHHDAPWPSCAVSPSCAH